MRHPLLQYHICPGTCCPLFWRSLQTHCLPSAAGLLPVATCTQLRRCTPCAPPLLIVFSTLVVMVAPLLHSRRQPGHVREVRRSNVGSVHHVKLSSSASLLVTMDQACIARPRQTRHLLHDFDYPTCQTATYRDHIATLALSDL